MSSDDHVTPMNRGKLLEAVTETLNTLTVLVPYGMELDDPNTADAHRLSGVHYALYGEYLTDADGRDIVTRVQIERIVSKP